MILHLCDKVHDINCNYCSMIDPRVTSILPTNNRKGRELRRGQYCSFIALLPFNLAIRYSTFYVEFASRQIEESISILNFFPQNRGHDFCFEFLPAKSRSRFLFWISSRQNRGDDFYFEFLPAKSTSRFLVWIPSRLIERHIELSIHSPPCATPIIADCQPNNRRRRMETVLCSPS